MHRKAFRNGFAAATLLVAAAASPASGAPRLQGRHEVSREFDRTLRLNPGQSLAIDHSQGNIEVKAEPGHEVRIHAAIHVSAVSEQAAAQFADRIVIGVSDRPNGAEVRTTYPRVDEHARISFAVDYVIVMPESAVLDLRNRFGNVTVAGLKTKGSIVSSHGRLGVQGFGGGRLENVFGPIEASEIGGDVEVTNANAPVSLTNLKGGATVTDRFGDVTIRGIRGTASIVTTNANVDVSDAWTDVAVRNAFGAVKLRDIGRDVTVNDTNGAIEAHGLRGAAELNTTFAAVTVSEVARALTISASNTRVTVANA